MGIIAVSDVHLGYMNASKTESFSDKKSFVSFLDGLAGRDDITDFVICGDLLDMWRRDMVGVTIENLDILSRFQKLASKMKVHYIAGNHDYHIRYLTRFPYPFGFTECIDPRKGIALQDGGKTFLFKHGYDFEPIMSESECFFDLLCSTSDEAGEFKSWLYDTISNIDAVRGQDIETALKMLGGFIDDAVKRAITALFQPKPCSASGGKAVGLPKKAVLSALLDHTTEERINGKDGGFNFNALKTAALNSGKGESSTVLVFGHTHRPFHTQNVINLGSWIQGYPIYDTYLEISSGNAKLKDYRTGKAIDMTSSPPEDLAGLLYLPKT